MNRSLCFLVLVAIVAIAPFSSVLGATALSGPSHLQLGQTGSFSVSTASTVSFPKYLSGTPGTCALGTNTSTLRKYVCPDGGTFTIKAPLTTGAFTIRADGSSLSVTVGTVVVPPTPAPTAAPTPTAVTITQDGDTFTVTGPQPIDVRFDHAIGIVATDCAEHWVRVPRWTPARRVGLLCGSWFTLSFPPGTWIINAGGVSVSVTP